MINDKKMCKEHKKQSFLYIIQLERNKLTIRKKTEKNIPTVALDVLYVIQMNIDPPYISNTT